METQVIRHSFKLVLSKGNDIPFDPSELATVEQAIENGEVAKLKRGIFNPSYFVSIVEDSERRTEFLERTKYPDERSIAQREAGMTPLKDLFADTKLMLDGSQVARIGS